MRAVLRESARLSFSARPEAKLMRVLSTEKGEPACRESKTCSRKGCGDTLFSRDRLATRPKRPMRGLHIPATF